ncbi:uncharacterized protein [Haliotis asinina]|uniref:uncharacterized protein n=1 Tax=Haliotis asinina TaxID=109174 RepID=UPI003531FD35
MSGDILPNYSPGCWFDCASFKNQAQVQTALFIPDRLLLPIVPSPDYQKPGYQSSIMDKNAAMSSFNPLQTKSNNHTESMTKVCTAAPKHPKYQTYISRLDSFVAWPIRYVPKTPEELASAGFFYIGSADRVTCFHCGITLRDWEAEHSPVAEHKRYAPKCQFAASHSHVEVLDGEKAQKESEGSSMVIDENAASNIDLHFTPASNDLHLGGGACAACEYPNASVVADPSVIVEGSDKSMDTSTLCENLQTLSIEVCDTEIEHIPSESHMDMEITSDITGSRGNQKEESNICQPKPVSKKLMLLRAENKRLKEQSTCRMCKNKPVCILFLPCGHLVTCSDCADTVHACVTCGKTILGTVKTFIKYGDNCHELDVSKTMEAGELQTDGHLGSAQVCMAGFSTTVPESESFKGRLETFATKPNEKENRVLALAGFSYTAPDTVQCGHCGLQLPLTHQLDNVLKEHQRSKPNCPFISKLCNHTPRTPPKHPEYREAAARLDSFTSWPRAYVPQSPESLVAAGFYYIGSADRVTCFQCGITLRDWDVGHDPVAEHREYSPNCEFISKPNLNQLGVARRVVSDFDIDVTTSASVGNLDLQSDVPNTDGNYDVVEKEAKEMGFTADKIHRAKDEFFRRYGRSCGTISDLVDSILTLGNDRSNHEEKLPNNAPSVVSNCQGSFRDEGHSSSPIKEIVKIDSEIKPTKSPGTKVKNAHLLLENKRLREQRLCRVCSQKDVCILFLPCGHLVTCETCAETVDDCVLCNKTIMGTVKTYLT